VLTVVILTVLILSDVMLIFYSDYCYSGRFILSVVMLNVVAPFLKILFKVLSVATIDREIQ
jgi:hypothetical protein